MVLDALFWILGKALDLAVFVFFLWIAYDTGYDRGWNARRGDAPPRRSWIR